jgi:hypothetical protein
LTWAVIASTGLSSSAAKYLIAFFFNAVAKTPFPVLEGNVEIMQFGPRRKIFHRASIGTLLNDWWRSEGRNKENDVKENRNHRVSDEESEEHDKT